MENLYVDPDNQNKCYLCDKVTICTYSAESNKKSLRYGTINLIRIRLFCCEECVIEFNKNHKCHSCNCEIDPNCEYNCIDCEYSRKANCKL